MVDRIERSGRPGHRQRPYARTLGCIASGWHHCTILQWQMLPVLPAAASAATASAGRDGLISRPLSPAPAWPCQQGQLLLLLLLLLLLQAQMSCCRHHRHCCHFLSALPALSAPTLCTAPAKDAIPHDCISWQAPLPLPLPDLPALPLLPAPLPLPSLLPPSCLTCPP